MIWFDNIYDLQYYHQPKGVPCYCEAMVYPFDIQLQGQIPGGNGSYTLKVYVYSANGLTLYEDATSYFDYYFGVLPGIGTHFFNARLKSFSPAMCAHECYILRAEVVQSGGVTVFNKYTERYCQNNCCDVPKDITLTQTGFSPLVVGNDHFVSAYASVALLGASSQLFVPEGDCGEPLIRIITKFDCIDKFTGDFYGTPDVVLSGSANFEYTKITILRGRIVRRPREIKREMSYNCRLLQSESTPQYLLEGFELLPPWKMYELEGQLHANKIYIDDFSGIREYRYSGGTPMRQVSKCFELFKLEANMEDCTQRQLFGCDVDCNKQLNFDGSHMVFAIPADYEGGGFYNSNGELVAVDYDGLQDYLRTRDGAIAVSDIDTAGLSCDAYKVVSVTSIGQIDTHLYYDIAVPGKKIYGVVVSDINELCAYLPKVCTKPAIGVYSVTEAICATPVAGVFVTEDIATDIIAITGYGDWDVVDVDSNASIYGNEVTFNLKVVNDQLTEDPADPEGDVQISEIIGVIGGAGRPAITIGLNDATANLAEGVGVTIDPNGIITYYGPVTSADPSDVTIELSNIKYNV